MSSDIAATSGSGVEDTATGRRALAILRHRTLLVIAALALLGAGAYYYAVPREADPHGAGKGPGRNQSLRVAASEVVRKDFPVILSGLGTVTPSATAVVKTRISGHLVDVHFTEAQNVKSGDPLASVDPRPYQLALAQSEGQLQKDVALLQNAERDLARYEALVRKMKDVISAQQIDAQRALIAQYKGTVAVDRALVEQARLNLSYCRITSPIDGRVGLRQIDVGNYVQPGDANGVAIVTRLSPITVIFTLPESRLPAVLKRLRTGEKLTVVAYDHERAAELARGRLIAIDNQIDQNSGTVKLRAEFPNDDERLFPNQFVNAELLVDTLRNVTLAPSSAVQQGAKGPFAYVVQGGETVRVQQLKLGASSGDEVVVEDGLAPGDRVVIEGADRLRDGATISLGDSPGAPSGPGAEPRGGRRPGGKHGAS